MGRWFGSTPACFPEMFLSAGSRSTFIPLAPQTRGGLFWELNHHLSNTTGKKKKKKEDFEVDSVSDARPIRVHSFCFLPG